MFVKKTTKYWKEVDNLVITPRFNCYHNQEQTEYYYWDVSSEAVYTTEDSFSKTTNEADLYYYPCTAFFSEETLTIVTMLETRIVLYRSVEDDFGSYTLSGSFVVAGTPDDYTYKEEESKTYAISKQGIVYKAGDLKYDYVRVGSPTISDGVVSGFSTSNYLKLINPFKPDSKPWEMVWKFKSTSAGTAQYFFGGSSSSAPNIHLYLSESKIVLDVGNGSSWVKTLISGTSVLSSNIYYWVKVTFDGTKYSLYLSTDGNDYNLENSYATTTPIGNMTATLIGVNRSAVTPFQGSIDLSESYIKLNGEYFWSGFYPEDVIGTKGHFPTLKKTVPYERIFEYTTAGTYTVEIPHDGDYELTVVGGGGGGAFVYSAKFWDGAAAGGSGGGFIGVTHLTKGTYTVTVGAGGAGNFNNNSATYATAGYGGDSKFGDIVTAGGATAPTARYDAQSQTGSVGGTVRYDVSDFSSVSLASNGNTGYGSNQADGGTYAGGASVYGGYGAGGQAAHGACKAGTAGYVKIQPIGIMYEKKFYY